MIPDSWLLMEHDPNCKTFYGLAEEMKNIYGDDLCERRVNDNTATQGIHINDIYVTCLMFRKIIIGGGLND